ncbi:hypothetical protein F7725_007546 [Dissostichus mawsoni]|uniref:Uncharacterized protein n=1 Tax=Dissostichus mawsoni TaxID=36200 RepID=A0A7J5Y5M1_DISMA|nr:hypothetical protein F7725_007546 [Dissostichus mawsoni]
MEIERNVLRGDLEYLNLRYGNLLKTRMKDEAEMDILRKENQNLRELKKPCTDDKDLEIARLREENRTLKLRCGVEEDEEPGTSSSSWQRCGVWTRRKRRTGR